MCGSCPPGTLGNLSTTTYTASAWIKEGVLSPSRVHCALLGFEKQAGQAAKLARLPLPGKEGAAEAAKVGWGRRGRAEWGWS